MNISVIIPVHNGANYIETAIQSVINQTLKPLEILVIDDNSIDKTAEIIKQYQEVTYIYQEKSGVSAARNLGIKLSKGKYIAFLDHDDWFPLDKLEKFMKVFINDPKIDVVRGLSRFHYENPEIRKTTKYNHKDYELDHQGVQVGTAVFCKSILETIEGFDSELIAAEDIDLWLRLKIADANIKNIDEIGVFYRQHENSTMRQDWFEKINKISTLKVINKSIQLRKKAN